MIDNRIPEGVRSFLILNLATLTAVARSGRETATIKALSDIVASECSQVVKTSPSASDQALSVAILPIIRGLTFPTEYSSAILVIITTSREAAPPARR
jgi:hypothetical protein